MSNYPPGVTGYEYAINGPDYEDDTDEPCWYCENTEGNVKQGYNKEVWIICGECGKQTDIEYDSDYYREDD